MFCDGVDQEFPTLTEAEQLYQQRLRCPDTATVELWNCAAGTMMRAKS